jgi:hypothetical protein
MDPQQPRPQEQFDETPLPPDLEERPTQRFQPVQEQPKKSHRRAIIIATSGLIVIIAALGGYLVYSQMSDDAVTTETTPPTPAPTTVSPVDGAANVMTDGTATEDELTATDDSSDVDDASQAASNVGDSVNENNF